MTLYQPDEEWPKHGEDAWNDVLDLARSKGWTLETFSSRAHRFGKIRCPQHLCQFPTIDSSARGTETFARNKRRIVERCGHGNSKPVSLAAAKTHLVSGERLADAAGRLVEQAASLEEIEELLASACTSAQSADEVLAAATAAEDNAVRQAKEAAALLKPTPYAGMSEAAPVLDGASSEALLVEGQLELVPADQQGRTALSRRLEALKERIEVLQVQAAPKLADT